MGQVGSGKRRDMAMIGGRRLGAIDGQQSTNTNGNSRLATIEGARKAAASESIGEMDWRQSTAANEKQQA